MIQTGRDLRVQNKQGWMPVHEAAALGQQECLRVILTVHSELIDTFNQKQQTPLLLAVEADHVSCVECLLEWGANPNICNKDGETPLCKACEVENGAIVELLLHFGAEVNRSCIQGWTALHEAVCRNHIEICEMLVKAGAKLSTPNRYGITPIFVAAQTGSAEAVGFLIKNGADVNSQAKDGATTLYEACKNGHKDVAELLLMNKANANRPTNNGLLPLHIAAQNGYNEIVSLLIHVTSRSRVQRSGISPLHLAAKNNQDDTLELLIQAGFDVNALLSPEHSCLYQDRRTTALYFAIASGNVAASAMLLEAGANPNLDTFSPILVAARQGCMETLRLLVEHGADVNALIPNLPTTFPSIIMLCLKHPPMLKYLMGNGCNAMSCFQCKYGSRPHPPLKPRFKEDLRLSEKEPCLQFCDIISSPSVSHWAGPIIDVLLDYVGNVKLCARLTDHLDSCEDWAGIKERTKIPCPLMQLCRVKIHQRVGSPRLRCSNILSLPGKLIKYLNHDE
ncbi:ankyrin repeat and SOCS box protein 2-like [Chanos chanos]|uniref:Ankyrin repeat and SOCS box protein 2-like n=1 Tax=Chanos chanos TaxID=29144 RepID=A0A6J2VB64_CHACN|nr:ankyrin repeat and SOCS box protein 2-like [Chanos chanos]